jgi:hypothetical protein
MNKYNATITQINAKIFTWKTQYGKNHGTVVHLKTSTITNKEVHNSSSSDSTKGYNIYIIKNYLFSEYN